MYPWDELFGRQKGHTSRSTRTRAGPSRRRRTPMPAPLPGFVPLTTLPRLLRERYRADPPPSYHCLRRLILNGFVDAELAGSNRLLIREADVPRVATLLGLAEPAP